MKKILLSLMVIVGLFSFTGCDTSDKDKMLKKLKDDGFNCTESSDETICTKEDSKKKKVFELYNSFINYEETIYDSGSTRLVIDISSMHYNKKDYDHIGEIEAYFKGEDLIEFYPETCEDESNCYLHVDEKVYPAPKEEYDEYKEYFATGQDKEYLRALNRDELGMGEEIRLGTIYDNMQEIKGNDKFTENVNEALRYFEKTLKDTGVALGE